jgi:hypothetical protein
MVRINKCHDFAWSRALWLESSRRIGAISLLLFIFYLGLGFYFLGYKDGRSAVDSWYLLAASITTVGLGDVHPSSESARASAIGLLPLGIIVLGESYLKSHLAEIHA